MSPVWTGLVLVVFVGLQVGASITASSVQGAFGDVAVSDDIFENEKGARIRGKLFRPKEATPSAPAPGVLFIHGYQSTRETGDAVAIELSRRGFVVLSIDTLGRGNSDIPVGRPGDPRFDETFGGRAALAHLKGYAFVRSDCVALVGHSLGAEIAFHLSLKQEKVEATVIIGYAYTGEVTPHAPRNLAMIFGRFDEFRDRMTQTRSFVREWMSTPRARAAFTADSPRLGVTYGSFDDGTARRVAAPSTIHIVEPHDEEVVAEVLSWMRSAFPQVAGTWIPAQDQIWPLKEWATLLAMIFGLAALIPLLALVGRLPFFAETAAAAGHLPPKGLDWAAPVIANGLLMWLYLPCAILLFLVHAYVVPIDGVFPMMVVNGIALWFVVISAAGWFLQLLWMKKQGEAVSWRTLGVSFVPGSNRRGVLVTALWAALAFGFAYGSEVALERALLVDYRFVFTFANDLTPYRWGMFALYYPFFFFGFFALSMTLHGRLGHPRPAGSSPLGRFFRASLRNIAVVLVPLILLWGAQYVPLFAWDVIPFEGPGGILVLFMINTMHIMGVLVLMVPLSTWCFELTGRPWLGAFLCAALVTWMLTSSQVIAPVPIQV